MAMGQLKRNSMHGVMSNTGFSGLTIYRNDGAIIIVPPNQITKRGGLVKKAINSKLDSITHETVIILESKGIRLYAQAGTPSCAM